MLGMGKRKSQATFGATLPRRSLTITRAGIPRIMSACDHSFRHMGLQYADGVNPLPGSGARRRYYAHVFFCERCLEKRAERIECGEPNSYGKPLEGAVLGDRNIIAPPHDRQSGYV